MNEFYIIHSFLTGKMTENGYNGNLLAWINLRYHIMFQRVYMVKD